MNEKELVELDLATASAFAEMVHVIGYLQGQVLDILGRARIEAIETQIKATLDGRLAISRTNENFLREVVAMLTESHEKIVSARQPVVLPSVEEGLAEQLSADLDNVLDAIVDPDILALARMVALDVFIGALNVSASRHIAPKQRGEVRERVAAIVLGALDQPINLSMSLTPVVIQNIITGLEAAKACIGVDEKRVEFAAMIQFARSLSSGCRRKCAIRIGAVRDGSNLVGKGILFEVKESARVAHEALFRDAGKNDGKYCSALLDKILPMVIHVRAHLEKLCVQKIAGAIDRSD